MDSGSGNAERRHGQHRAFGLVFRSSVPLPELPPAGVEEEPDVEFAEGEVPESLPDAQVEGVRYQVAADRVLLRVDGVARYLAIGGRRVWIARTPGATDADVRAFLLTVVLGVLLQQRDELVLHGSAIAVEGEAVLFLGRSGAGKSTLATAFGRRGYPVLTDDLCVLRARADGRLVVQSGMPHTKLWADSLAQLALAPDELERVRNKLEKRIVPLRGAFATEALPVARVFVLTSGHAGPVQLQPLQGPSKFAAFKNHTYRFGLLAATSEKTRHFQHALALARQVPVQAALRSEAGFQLEEFVALIERTWRP